MTDIHSDGGEPTRRLPPARKRTRPTPPMLLPERGVQRAAISSPFSPTPSSAFPCAIHAAGGSLACPDDYKVGHCRPPKHSQFKPGQSGNPRGRPKNAKGVNTIVRELLLARMKIRTARGEKSVAGIEAVLMKMMEHATKGNVRALEVLLRYYEQAVPEGSSAPQDAPGQKDISAADKASMALLCDMLVAEAQAASSYTEESRSC